MARQRRKIWTQIRRSTTFKAEAASAANTPTRRVRGLWLVVQPSRPAGSVRRCATVEQSNGKPQQAHAARAFGIARRSPVSGARLRSTRSRARCRSGGETSRRRATCPPGRDRPPMSAPVRRTSLRALPRRTPTAPERGRPVRESDSLRGGQGCWATSATTTASGSRPATA